MSYSTNSKELYVLRDEIKRLETILDALEKNITFLSDNSTFLNWVDITDKSSYVLALNYKENKELHIKLLNREIDLINEETQNLKLEKIYLNANYRIGGRLGALYGFIFGRLFGCLFADVREAYLRKKEIIDQREHLKRQLNLMHDNLNKELVRLNEINLKLKRRNEKF